MEDDVVIGGLLVPARLIALVKAGEWVPPSNEILLDVFGEIPVRPCFYGERMLHAENDAWHADPGIAGPPQPITEANVGIVVVRSLVIADLGPDMPVVLDYRESITSPRVLYPRGLVWTQIAVTFEELSLRLFPRLDPEARLGKSLGGVSRWTVTSDSSETPCTWRA